MSKPLAVITGAGSGIGRSLTLALIEKGCQVIAVGRRASLLDELQTHDPENIISVIADVATEDGQQAVQASVQGAGKLAYLVHNAATVSPEGGLLSAAPAAFRQMLAVNIEAPLTLTQLLLESLDSGSRVLNVSSGAAHSAFPGIGPYCVSKAALFMMYQVLQPELAAHQIYIGSVKPGIVDTAMTDQIAGMTGSYDITSNFTALKESKEMIKPEIVARFMTWLLTEVPGDVFSAHEWDIYERAHHNRWIEDGEVPMLS